MPDIPEEAVRAAERAWLDSEGREGKASVRAILEAAAPGLAAVRDAEMERLREERDQAIAHDRQPYPTQWAYDQACAALEKHRKRADEAEAKIASYENAITWGVSCTRHAELLDECRSQEERAERAERERNEFRVRADRAQAALNALTAEPPPLPDGTDDDVARQGYAERTIDQWRKYGTHWRARAEKAERESVGLAAALARVRNLAGVYEVNAASASDTAARNYFELFAEEIRGALEPPPELLDEEETGRHVEP